jgi:SAM-dependent methyltransferase
VYSVWSRETGTWPGCWPHTGLPPLWERLPGFATLIRIILEQQVSLASARAAYDRLEQKLGRVAPDSFLALSDGDLILQNRSKKDRERKMTTNPWFGIPAADYEGHMSSPGVGQQAFIADLFRSALAAHDCCSVALLGCATGNGLEHVDIHCTERITAVDFNPEYLEILRRRFGRRLPGLEILQADLTSCSLDPGAYSLSFAALVFEYLDPAPLLQRIASWLAPQGVLVALLQLPTAVGGKVSTSPYSSLQQLDGIMNLVDPAAFGVYAKEAGLKEVNTETVTLPSGKPFLIGTYGIQERGGSP